MQSLNYWKQFESTGKIEDYLSYKSGGDAAIHSSMGTQTEPEQSLRQQGAKPYAGVRMCNGNDTETDGIRGI